MKSYNVVLDHPFFEARKRLASGGQISEENADSVFDVRSKEFLQARGLP